MTRVVEISAAAGPEAPEQAGAEDCAVELVDQTAYSLAGRNLLSHAAS